MFGPMVCGIETEYGIFVQGEDVSAVAASSMLIDAYAAIGRAKSGWNFSDESPHVDTRSGDHGQSTYPVVEPSMSNSVLPNGARYYVDHAHPEYSTPECVGPFQALLYDLAGEEVVRLSLDRANADLPPGVRLVAHKNNSDGRGNSYGCHENYLVERNVPFGLLTRSMTVHFVSRQIYCGAGKIGVEQFREGEIRPRFQLSQRADFFEEEIGLETTVRRPIINTRDEPHCDPSRWRRLHVIAGDANMSQVATVLKLGTTSIILSMLEDDHWPADLEIADPVSEIRAVSHDTSLSHLIRLTDGRRMTATQIQMVLWERAAEWCRHRETDADITWVLDRWGQILHALQEDPMSLVGTVDWVAKLRLAEGLAERHGLPWDHPRMRAVDLQYHDMDPARNLHRRIGMDELMSPEDVRRAVHVPPESTRAFFRGECVRRWPEQISSANWDSIVFQDSKGLMKRVAMMDPLKGTRNHVGALLDSVQSVDELLMRLGDEVVENVVDDPGW